MSDDDEESTSGSQSTLFGSVKSSKSSASFFGSCKSTGLCKEYFFKFFQRGRKLILDGGTQLNNKNLIFAKISSFFIFYSIKSPKDGGT